MFQRLAPICFLVTALGSGVSSAYALREDSTGHADHWAARADFVLDEKAAAILKESHTLDATQAALATMEQAVPELAFSLTTGKTDGVHYAQKGSNQNAIVAIDDSWPFDENAIAVTVVTVNTTSHEIVDADIALNAVARKFKVLGSRGDPRSSYDDIQNTLTHELGHAMGLAHVPDEPTAVMYPSAELGETSKRELTTDDQAGLAALYSDVSASSTSKPHSAQGCSAAPDAKSALPFFALLATLFLFRRRMPFLPRTREGWQWTAALALGLVPAFAFAAPRPAANVAEAEWSATGEVTASRSAGRIHGLLFTELTVRTHGCLKGNCPSEFTIQVPGGREGELEQMVEGLPVPELATSVAVTRLPDATAALKRVTPMHLYRMDRAEDRAALQQGLRAANLSDQLGQGSPTTSASSTTHTTSR